jgi:hypothetical protein
VAALRGGAGAVHEPGRGGWVGWGAGGGAALGRPGRCAARAPCCGGAWACGAGRGLPVG